MIGLDPLAEASADDFATMPLVLAPELMLTEVANTLWKLHKAYLFQYIDPKLALIDARDLIDQMNRIGTFAMKQSPWRCFWITCFATA